MNKDFSLRFIDLVHEKNDTLTNKERTAHSDNAKREAWKYITDRINAEYASNMTVKQAEDKWKYLKRTSKQANATFNKEIRNTGGGPAPKKLSLPQTKVVELLGETASFKGIQNSVESAIFPVVPNTSRNEDEENQPDIQTELTYSPACSKKRTYAEALSSAKKYKAEDRQIVQLQKEVLEKQLEEIEENKKLRTLQTRVFEKLENVIDNLAAGGEVQSQSFLTLLNSD